MPDRKKAIAEDETTLDVSVEGGPIEATGGEPKGKLKEESPYLSETEIEAGGKYYVGDRFVDANGNEV